MYSHCWKPLTFPLAHVNRAKQRLRGSAPHTHSNGSDEAFDSFLFAILRTYLSKSGHFGILLIQALYHLPPGGTGPVLHCQNTKLIVTMVLKSGENENNLAPRLASERPGAKHMNTSCLLFFLSLGNQCGLHQCQQMK